MIKALLKLSWKFLVNLTIQPRNSTLTHLAKANENVRPHKNLYTGAHSNFLLNTKTWK